MTCEHPKGKQIGMAFRLVDGIGEYYRRRRCPECGKVFTTIERAADDLPQDVTTLVELERLIDDRIHVALAKRDK